MIYSVPSQGHEESALKAARFAVLAGPGDEQFRDCRARAAAALQILNGAAAMQLQQGSVHILGPNVDLDAMAVPSMVIGPDRSLAPVLAFSPPVAAAGTDEIGLSHLCWGRVNGVTVVANSALVVAATVGADLSPESVSMLSLAGFLFGGRTLFEGVQRLEAGQAMQFGPHGTTVVDHADEEWSRLPRRASTLLRRIVADLDEEHPEACIELSGGMDSRAVLAAIPPGARHGKLAVTLGRDTDADVQIAGRLVRMAKMDWQVIDPRGVLAGLPLDELRRQTFVAARERDFVFNTLAALTLSTAEEAIPEGPRFTGANGEFARGFYYPGVLTDGRVTRRRAAQLARWRLFTNDGTAASSLREDLATHGRQFTTSAFHRELDGLGPRSWRATLDEFYLTGRMANWAGSSYVARSPSKAALGPFFHPDFLVWARSLPQRWLHRQRCFAGMVVDLDDALAQVPLAGGPSPMQISDGSMLDHARTGMGLAERILRKTVQRVRGSAKTPPPQRSLQTLLLRAWQPRDSDILASTGLFRREFVERMAGTGQPVDGPTLSLAMNVVGARRFLDVVATTVQPSTSTGPEET